MTTRENVEVIDPVDPARVEAVREGRSGVVVVAYLDISSENYVAAGEPGDLVLGMSRGASAMLWGMLTSLLRDGAVVRLEDEAERGVLQFLAAGVDRQAFMAPLMEALANDTGGGVRVNADDPMQGFMERQRGVD